MTRKETNTQEKRTYHPPDNMKPNAPELHVQRVQTAWRTFLFLLGLVIAPGCSRESPATSPLEGQWMLRLDTAGGSGGPFVTTGIVAIQADLARYPDDPEQSDSAMIGRAYINSALAGTDSPSLFQQGPGADRIETVHVFSRGAQLVIHLAPHLKDASPILTGRLTQDGIAGTWHSTIENGGFKEGSFTMTRTRAEEYADSAAIRAARGVRDWNTS
jgi:hypothetical protein